MKYIQDRLRAERDEILKQIDQEAHIYVCGSVKTIVPGVREAFVDILSAYGDGDDQLDELQKKGRYSVESFS